jgi:hypothetical protein
MTDGRSVVLRANVKSEGAEIQQVMNAVPPLKQRSRTGSHHSLHEFRWTKTKDRGTAWCTCGYWTLWGASLESARRSYGYHRSNRLAAPAKDATEGHDAA